MSNMMEVLFSCVTNDLQASITAWDPRTGTNLMTYKGGGMVQPRSLCILRSEYVLAANNAKPLLHVWPINAQEQISSVRFVVPGRVNALALSPDGLYLVAGIQETLYIWHLATGRMLNTIAKHYQTINCIRFTEDSSHFVSAGQDGSVQVWNLTQLVGRGDDNQTPLYSFNDHGLPVTDVHIGAGGMRAYMFTVSLDRTLKVYDLSGGTLLLNVVYPEPLYSVISNVLETIVFVGTGEGNIFEIHTDALPRTKEYHMETDHTNCFTGHKAGAPVTCLALSLDGQTLISGGTDEQVCLWHISSRQLVKTLKLKGAVTNLQLRLTNPAIFNPEQKQPIVFGGNLRRMLDPPDENDNEVIEILITEENAGYDDEAEYEAAKKAIYAETMQTSTLMAAANTSNHLNTTSSFEEVEKLRAEIEQLKHINKQLFAVSTKHLLRKKK